MAATIVEFGDQLLRTRDLDPVYVAVAASGLDSSTTYRLLLAYWCFYHLGVAAYIAEEGHTPKQFWAFMATAAKNEGVLKDGSKPWPRGAERRHFRGAQAVDPVGSLIAKYRDAEEAVLGMLGGCIPGLSYTFKSVTGAVQRHRGFGPWIAFKIADMAERVLRLPVDFSDCELGIYKDPRQGAAVAFVQKHGGSVPGKFQHELDGPPWHYAITDDELRYTVDHYVKLWRRKHALAPPWNDRPVNVQEIETIFCKYKSHLKGHYPEGKDTREIGHGLEGWGDLAEQLKKGLPS
jgi:hypothetical protein